ncbi:hypothetical protein CEXT_702461 [Caerostris extrusa]|uniref:Uncharacterized protein n=1 Tax=Caerostris extrusa TaxID=172846 RepID=A0AAV4TA49_CAEEX|nr:hypothetical protein CEXT_702461 [Caerostris extrusa]
MFHRNYVYDDHRKNTPYDKRALLSSFVLIPPPPLHSKQWTNERPMEGDCEQGLNAGAHRFTQKLIRARDDRWPRFRSPY